MVDAARGVRTKRNQFASRLFNMHRSSRRGPPRKRDRESGSLDLEGAIFFCVTSRRRAAGDKT